VQYGTVKRLEEDYKNIQLNVIHQTEINSIEAEKFNTIFEAIFNYRSVISVYFIFTFYDYVLVDLIVKTIIS